MSQPSSGDVRTDSTNGNFRLSSLAQGKERDEGSMDCSGDDRAFTNESYTLWQLTAEDIQAKRLIIEDFGRRLLLDDSVNDIELLDLHDSKQLQIATAGDGACGWHAVFGEPNVSRKLHGIDARKRMAELLPVDFDVLVSMFDAGHAAFRGLRTSLWSEFALPYYKHLLHPESNPLEFNEQEYFRMTFEESLYDTIREEGLNHHLENERITQDKEEARNMFWAESRNFFHSDFESVWTVLAVKASLLPDVDCNYS